MALVSVVPSTGATWLDVVLQIVIGTFALAIAAAGVLLPAFLVQRRSKRQEAHAKNVEAALGKPNGQGNITQMLEGLTLSVTAIDARVTKIENRTWRRRVAHALAPPEDR